MTGAALSAALPAVALAACMAARRPSSFPGAT